MSITILPKRQVASSPGQERLASSVPNLPRAENHQLEDGHPNSGFLPRSSGKAEPSLRYRCSEWAIALFGVVTEIRSLGGRIRFRLKQRYHVRGLDLGAYHQVGDDGRLRVNTRTHACTQDIENFAAAHPWATIVELEMYRDAWARGATWAESNSGSCKREPGKS